ncbi:MAG: succinylglutamate desuccinylase/aspartoacylase family protein [Vicingaceae bacterium]|nr:succinylglutamate desuccinylase [Flavobacteriales bacterium]MDF1674548.1 succinylglutamate desuccinylase/aspartoacylase family protein [Vicingaceae bacterium]|tara:strand:- start:12754 stop:13719 length:966 start_codon:yes stop_codon:yes gene_type:complete
MDTDVFHFLGKKIGRGETVQLNIDIARLHTRTAIEVPVIVSRGKNPGPVILLNAGIHGDEVNGVEIVRQIIAKNYHKPTNGTVICIPVLNVFGFLHQTREFPDGRDLNRVFPGSKEGSLGSRFAYFFMKEIVPKIDYCIDYHTGASKRFNYTHIRIEGVDKETIELAQVFGAPFIMLSKVLPKSLRSEAAKKGVKVLLFEGGKALDLDRAVTKVGVAGALKVMHKIGLRDFSKEIAAYPKTESITLSDSSWTRARYSGMFRTYVSIGSYVKKGTVLGTISDPFGEFEKRVISKHDGYIVCSNHSPIVNQGDALFHVGFDIT